MVKRGWLRETVWAVGGNSSHRANTFDPELYGGTIVLRLVRQSLLQRRLGGLLK